MPLEKRSQFRADMIADGKRTLQLYVCGVSSLADSLNHIADLPSSHFVTLLVADFGLQDSTELAEWARALIGAGTRYFCAWGNQSDHAHNVFDEVCCDFEPDRGSVILTTNHCDSLEESIWFSLNCAQPTPPYDQDWNGILAITVDDAESLAKIRTVFSDPVEFCENLDY